MLQTVYHITEVPAGIPIKQISVTDREQAKEILENGEYTVGWYYRPKQTAKWLIVKKSEYDRNQY